MFKMKMKLKKYYWIVFVIVVVTIGIIFLCGNFNVLSKVNNKQIVSIGFAGANEGEIFFEFPSEQRQEFIALLNEAPIGKFPTRVGEYKGGAPTFLTRIIFADNSSIDVSYASLSYGYFLVVNGKHYRCDEESVDKFRNIHYECKGIFDNQE